MVEAAGPDNRVDHVDIVNTTKEIRNLLRPHPDIVTLTTIVASLILKHSGGMNFSTFLRLSPDHPRKAPVLKALSTDFAPIENFIEHDGEVAEADRPKLLDRVAQL